MTFEKMDGQHPFQYWCNPSADHIGRSVEEFLALMAGPTHIHLSGKDNTRCRVVVTLLHGNEPSGLTAIFHLIKKGIEPTVDIHCFIPNVDAAIEPPGFYYRALPETRDLNRCFQPPFEDAQGILANALLDSIKMLQPEAAIDIHNTSGSSPSFAVTTFMDARHDALASLFTQRLIVTDLKLGALMEISEILCPTVTIECGGTQDKESDWLAEEGLQKFMTVEDVLTPPPTDFPLEFFHNPIRLELRDRQSGFLAYGNSASAQGGLTLRADIEHHNFSFVTPDTHLGFIEKAAMNELTAKNSQGEEKLHDYFHSVDGLLFPKKTLKLFMITANLDIARSDCLFYLVAVDN